MNRNPAAPLAEAAPQGLRALCPPHSRIPAGISDSHWNSRDSCLAPCEARGLLAPHPSRAGARTPIKATDSLLKHGLEPKHGFARVTLSHV